ncbi:MAG: ATP phosphoribosyltransferase regulatory subunit [Desertifilum sp.]|nr:ATP phosphoribosyltransferase regulatory subunit [Desertifilum sp.]
MVYQSPVGARDLLPLDVAQKRWIEKRLQQVFHQWGYHRIITSTLERLDTLMAGGAIERSTVIQLIDTEDELLGLRPEVTASIARAAIMHLNDASYPRRLYYNANVFRRSQRGVHGRQQEFYQAGVELLCGAGVLADAEILLLLGECLRSCGIGTCHLVLGEAGLTRSLLNDFPPHLRETVRTAIAHLDRTTLETLPLEPQLRERALQLFDLRGLPADVLQKVSQLSLDPAQQEAVNNLKTLVDLLQDFHARIPNPDLQIILDLSLIQTFDYYTGIVFEVVSGSEARVLGQGGRYDQLLGTYHPQGKTYPGIGFCLNIEDLHYTLLNSDRLPQHLPISDCIVAAQTPQATAAAFAYAHQLRSSQPENRVEVELGPDRSAEEVRAIARRRQIAQIIWVNAQGETQTEQMESAPRSKETGLHASPIE